MGLQIMQERAEAVGAQIQIESEPGAGTQVSVLWLALDEAGLENGREEQTTWEREKVFAS
jgi:signal transduction histidine kinase